MSSFESRTNQEKLSLIQASGFNKLVSIYQKNRDSPWYKWLEVNNIFPRPGKQGLVGLMTVKNDQEGNTFVFKISQYINYLVQHELSVMKSLNTISNFCPHFCKAIGGILCEIDSTCRKEGNPFVKKSNYIIEKEVLLMEYLKNTSKFYNYIKSSKIDEDVLYSTIKQVLLAISIAQNKKQFSHYDLHSNNIMMKKCDKNLVFLYILDENNQFCVATRGVYPVIIDFGFSYIKDMDNGPLWPSLSHTEVGFMSSEYDPVADPKLFLITVSNEIKIYRKSKQSKKLRNIVKNNYKKLLVEWDSGWDNDVKKSASDFVLDILKSYNDESKLFKKYDHYCIDILQTLIILPLEEQDYSNISVSYITFIHEFSKIERLISDPFHCLYVLKGIVDAARAVRSDYNNTNSRIHAVSYFRKSLHEHVDSIAKFCNIKDLHYERMLCSLYVLSRNIEGVLYEHVHSRMEKKKKEYEQLPLKTPEEICAVIDLNIEDTYEFNSKTNIIVMDCIKESCYFLDLNEEEIDEINSYVSISRGPELYRILKNK